MVGGRRWPGSRHAQLSWWWLSEQAYLRHEAIAANDPAPGTSSTSTPARSASSAASPWSPSWPRCWLAGAMLTAVTPLAWLPVLAVLVPVLAWIGRPADKPIMTSAVVPVAYEPLTMEAIVRALGALGIAEMNKALREYPDKAVVPIDPPMRDGPGWLARLDLPLRRDRRGGQREARGTRLRAAPPAGLRVARDRAQAAPRRAEPVRRPTRT